MSGGWRADARLGELIEGSLLPLLAGRDHAGENAQDVDLMRRGRAVVSEVQGAAEGIGDEGDEQPRASQRDRVPERGAAGLARRVKGAEARATGGGSRGPLKKAIIRLNGRVREEKNGAALSELCDALRVGREDGV